MVNTTVGTFCLFQYSSHKPRNIGKIGLPHFAFYTDFEKMACHKPRNFYNIMNEY